MTKKAVAKSKKEAYLDPMHSVGYLCRINFRVFSKALEELTSPHGVTAGQWRLLRVLWEEDGITQRLLSSRVGITEATTAKAVAGLEKSGLITRREDKEDRRRMLIRLTPRAKKLKQKLLPMVVDVNERALNGISRKDIETTRRVLAQSFENLGGNGL